MDDENLIKEETITTTTYTLPDGRKYTDYAVAKSFLNSYKKELERQQIAQKQQEEEKEILKSLFCEGNPKYGGFWIYLSDKESFNKIKKIKLDHDKHDWEKGWNYVEFKEYKSCNNDDYEDEDEEGKPDGNFNVTTIDTEIELNNKV